MILVGLTGSIASGKSLVASLWAERGAVVVDADRVGHDVIAPGGAAFEGVVHAFGEEIRGTGGEIDRKKLGQIVFADPDRMRELEAIVHPALLAELERRIHDAAVSGARVIVVDAALIYEFGIEDSFDLVVCVTTPPEAQLERLIGRGLSAEEGRRRIAAQLPAAAKVSRAGLVIDNSGDRAALRASADCAWNHIMNMTQRPGTAPIRLTRKDPPS